LDSAAGIAQALPLDGLVLEKLVGGGFDDEAITQHSAFDDARRWWRRNDRAVQFALQRLVRALHDDHARRNYVEVLALRVAEAPHLDAALRTEPQSSRHAVVLRHPLQVFGKRLTTRVLALAALRRLRSVSSVAARRRRFRHWCGAVIARLRDHRPRQGQLRLDCSQ